MSEKVTLLASQVKVVRVVGRRVGSRPPHFHLEDTTLCFGIPSQFVLPPLRN